MSKVSIRDLDLRGKRVFIRVDFNVPLEDGRISDDTRLRASLPTVKYALDAGATVVLASHLGRPKGKKNPQFSLRPVADRLAELLGRPVALVDKKTSAQDVNAALKEASTGGLKGLLQFSEEELVSIDFKGNPHSSIVDAPYTKVMDGDFVKVLSWYDNEWGYSNRCVDLLRLLVKRGI